MCFNHESVVTRRVAVGCYSRTAPSGRLNARSKHRKTSRGDHFANKLANKPRVAVVHERARQQARFTKNLGTVTRAEHEFACARIALPAAGDKPPNARTSPRRLAIKAAARDLRRI